MRRLGLDFLPFGVVLALLITMVAMRDPVLLFRAICVPAPEYALNLSIEDYKLLDLKDQDLRRLARQALL